MPRGTAADFLEDPDARAATAATAGCPEQSINQPFIVLTETKFITKHIRTTGCPEHTKHIRITPHPIDAYPRAMARAVSDKVFLYYGTLLWNTVYLTCQFEVTSFYFTENTVSPLLLRARGQLVRRSDGRVGGREGGEKGPFS